MWFVYQVTASRCEHEPLNRWVDPIQYFWVSLLIAVPPLEFQDTVGGVGAGLPPQHMAYVSMNVLPDHEAGATLLYRSHRRTRARPHSVRVR